VTKIPLPSLTPVITVRETMDNATKNFSASVEQSGRS
jgi:hypothetical protein